MKQSFVPAILKREPFVAFEPNDGHDEANRMEADNYRLSFYSCCLQICIYKLPKYVFTKHTPTYITTNALDINQINELDTKYLCENAPNMYLQML